MVYLFGDSTVKVNSGTPEHQLLIDNNINVKSIPGLPIFSRRVFDFLDERKRKNEVVFFSCGTPFQGSREHEFILANCESDDLESRIFDGRWQIWEDTKVDDRVETFKSTIPWHDREKIKNNFLVFIEHIKKSYPHVYFLPLGSYRMAQFWENSITAWPEMQAYSAIDLSDIPAVDFSSRLGHLEPKGFEQLIQKIKILESAIAQK